MPNTAMPRCVLRFAAVLLVTALVVGLTQTTANAQTEASQGRPPNVLLIISDDQAWTDFGFMGHETINTPRIDQLAAQGATFTRGYVPSSLCRPSLMSIITGQFASRHQITSNDPASGVNRNEMLRHSRAAATLPELLAPSGYVSLQTGKWWEGSYQDGGFTHGMTHGDITRGGRHGDEGLKIGRNGLEPVYEFWDGPAREQPWFVWYAPFLPHTPHNPPQRLLDKYRELAPTIQIARYWAMCEWFDETVGQLLDGLEERGLTEETLVVFVTDNGWIQRPNANGYAPRSKRTPYESGIRTPIMFRWPGTIEPRRDEETLISSIDLAPTILAACGLEIPENMQGLDVRPAMRGKDLPRETIFGEIFSHNAVDLNNAEASLLSRWVIDGRWKLIDPLPLSAERLGELPQEKEITTQSGAAELYDLQSDPHEEHNLAKEKPGVVERLRALIEAN